MTYYGIYLCAHYHSVIVCYFGVIGSYTWIYAMTHPAVSIICCQGAGCPHCIQSLFWLQSKRLSIKSTAVIPFFSKLRYAAQGKTVLQTVIAGLLMLLDLCTHTHITHQQTYYSYLTSHIQAFHQICHCVCQCVCSLPSIHTVIYFSHHCFLFYYSQDES